MQKRMLLGTANRLNNDIPSHQPKLRWSEVSESLKQLRDARNAHLDRVLNPEPQSSADARVQRWIVHELLSPEPHVGHPIVNHHNLWFHSTGETEIPSTPIADPRWFLELLVFDGVIRDFSTTDALHSRWRVPSNCTIEQLLMRLELNCMTLDPIKELANDDEDLHLRDRCAVIDGRLYAHPNSPWIDDLNRGLLQPQVIHSDFGSLDQHLHQVSLRVGSPCILVHGPCQHIAVFCKVRAPHWHDEQLEADLSFHNNKNANIPLCLWRRSPRVAHCVACKSSAELLIHNDPRLPYHQAPMCQNCVRLYGEIDPSSVRIGHPE